MIGGRSIYLVIKIKITIFTIMKKKIIHGDYRSCSKLNYLYSIWRSIKQRCYNDNNPRYPHYGGRGIIVYYDWLNDYQTFKDWILTNLGERPEGYSIDRINNDGNYEPGNLRWASVIIQNNNQSNNIKFKLTEDELNEVHNMIKNYVPFKIISNNFNIGISTIGFIKTNHPELCELPPRKPVLNKSEINNIKILLDKGTTINDILLIYPVCKSTIKRIKKTLPEGLR